MSGQILRSLLSGLKVKAGRYSARRNQRTQLYSSEVFEPRILLSAAQLVTAPGPRLTAVTGNKDSIRAAMSSDGNVVAFTAGNNDSVDPSLSADGNFAFFKSAANNLVTGDTNGSADFFRKNLATCEIVQVNVSASGTQATTSSDLYMDHIVTSADGRYAAFAMGSSNLGNGIFVKDLDSSSNVLREVTVDFNRLQSWGVAISDDDVCLDFARFGGRRHHQRNGCLCSERNDCDHCCSQCSLGVAAE